MLSNFPVDVFDRTDGEAAPLADVRDQAVVRPDAAQRQKYDVHGTFSLARAMVGTMTSFHDQIHIDEPSTLARTMFVDTMGVRATDFDIDTGMQDLLFDSGRRAATEFLADWDFDRYIAEFRSGSVVDLTAEHPRVDAG